MTLGEDVGDWVLGQETDALSDSEDYGSGDNLCLRKDSCIGLWR